MEEVVAAMKIERKFASAFLAAFLALGVVGVGAFLNARQLLIATDLVSHSHATLASLGDLLRSIQGANTGAQEYFLTGEQAYLVPYQAGLEEIGQGLDDLRRQTADNPAQQKNIDLLQAGTNRQIAYLHQRVEVRRAGGLPAILPLLNLDGKGILDEIRFRAATIRSAELRLLDHRQELVRQTADRTFTALFILAGLMAFFLVAAYRFLYDNLTRRRRANAAWQASAEKFRGVFETTFDAVVIADEAGNIQISNPRAQKLFGYTARELIGSCLDNLLQTLPAGSTHGAEDAVPQVVGKRRDQTVFPIESNECILEIGKERLSLHAVRDLSALAQAEAALAKSFEELKRSDIELDRLAYVAGHDLQNPLSAVRGCTELLTTHYQDKLDETAKASLHGAVEGINRLQKLIDDLQTLARVDAQARPHEDIDCQDVLDKLVVALERIIRGSQTTIETPIPLPRVRGDARQIRQLFENLLDNAIKFRGSEPPRITITASLQSEQTWRFSVKDNGIGIDPRYCERIFIVFQRLHSEEQYPGTGVGLAVCQKIVERHGGKIWVESEPGAGANFLFTLPSGQSSMP